MFQLSPKTRRLLALFADADYGAEFTYAEILQETECDLVESDRQRVYSVNRILERDHRKSLMNIRGRGYKVAHPREHAEAMTIRKHRAGKQIQLATRTGQATAIEQLSEQELRTFADTQVAISRVAQALLYHDQRLARIEQKLGIVDEPAVDGVAEEIHDQAA
jgi:hypothetical protein